MPTLHVHLDESGDLSFRPTGTRYYVFAAAWTYDPAPLARELTALRFSLLKRGHNIEAFHAAEDKQAHRDAVVELLRQHEAWRFAALVVEKAKVYPTLREPHRFYPRFASMVLRFVFRGRVEPGTETVLIFTDALPVKRDRDAAEKAIKQACREALDRGVRFEAYHHRRASNAWIQAVDYCSWAVFRKWEQRDARTYDQLGARLATPELDVLRYGTWRYY